MRLVPKLRGWWSWRGMRHLYFLLLLCHLNHLTPFGRKKEGEVGGKGFGGGMRF